MKWLHLIHTMNPEAGGPMNALTSLSKIFPTYGHEIEIACVDAPESPWLNRVPVKVHALGPAFFKYGYSPRLLGWLNENSHQYDFIVIHGIWNYHTYAGWKSHRRTKVPYFLFVHGMLDPWFRDTYPLKHVKKTIYWRACLHKALRDAKNVIFTTEEEKQRASESFSPYQCDGVTINYGTVGAVGDKEKQRELFLKEFPQVKDKRVLLFIGRIHPKKGCDLLIDAFAAEAMNRKEWQLVIAGPDDAAWQPKLQSKAESLGIADRIVWTGMLTGDVKWGAFHVADAFILPSHQENFGIAVAEALSCGVPVCISNKVNIWREIEADGAGFVADDTLAGTQELLRKLFNCEIGSWSKQREVAYQCFRQRFDLNRGAESIVKLFVDRISQEKNSSSSH